VLARELAATVRESVRQNHDAAPRERDHFSGVQDFQNVRAWQRARALSLRVDTLARGFPRDYGALRSQIRRAADGISAAIAEGCGAATQREFARYLDIAIKTTSETQSHIISARDRRLISNATHSELVDEISQIRRMLYALRKKVLGDLP
jgi:four helix bundle protein